MPDRNLRIGELRLRVAGLSRDEARHLGEQVARRVAGRVTQHGRLGQLGALEMRLALPSGTPRDLLAHMVADRIVFGLQ
jgi:hypothetical protein